MKKGFVKKQIQVNLFKNRERLTDIENKLMITKGEGYRDKLGVWN